MKMRWRHHLCRWMLALLWLACAPRAASALPDVDVTEELAGTLIGDRVAVLLDGTGALTLDQVRAADAAGKLAPPSSDMRFGHVPGAALWVRFRARNRAPEARAFLLEVGYSHLDDVTLFVPRAAGDGERVSLGDRQPFETRAVPHPDFFFEQELGPDSSQTYYLRVQTSGLLNAPLTVWTERAFMDRMYLRWTLPYVFYGAVLVTAAYHLLLFFVTGIHGHGYFALVALGLGFAQFCLLGHLFQFVLPHDSALVQRITLASLNINIATHAAFSGSYSREETTLPLWINRMARAIAAYALLSTAAVLVLPFRAGMLVVALGIGGCALSGCAAGLLVWRFADRHILVRSRSWIYGFLLGWLVALTGYILQVLVITRRLPSTPLSDYSLQLGAMAQFVLVGAAAATRLRVLRDQDVALSAELGEKVTSLRAAVELTESETARAGAARRAKDEVIATMTHELRTPLNAIINVPQGLVSEFVDAPGAECSACRTRFELEEGETYIASAACPECSAAGTLREVSVVRFVGPPEKTVQLLALIEKAGRHLSQLVDDVLEGSGTNPHEALVPRAMDAVAMLNDVLEQLSPMARAQGVALELTSASAALWIEADELKLRQVLINLLGNAMKFSPRGGVVSVRLSVRDHQCLFAVSDRGIGIDAHRLPHVFEAYAQAHRGSGRSFGGTGLGLSIARSLVRLHGGEIWVESKPLKGSTFSFWIPAGNARAPRSVASVAPRPLR
jgi:signal transduction histidine kinase